MPPRPCTLNQALVFLPRAKLDKAICLSKARKAPELSGKLLILTMMTRASKEALFVGSWTI